MLKKVIFFNFELILYMKTQVPIEEKKPKNSNTIDIPIKIRRKSDV